MTLSTVARMTRRAAQIDMDVAARMALRCRANSVAATPIEQPRDALADRHTTAAIRAGVDAGSAQLVGAYVAATERQQATTPTGSAMSPAVLAAIAAAAPKADHQPGPIASPTRRRSPNGRVAAGRAEMSAALATIDQWWPGELAERTGLDRAESAAGRFVVLSRDSAGKVETFSFLSSSAA